MVCEDVCGLLVVDGDLWRFDAENLPLIFFQRWHFDLSAKSRERIFLVFGSSLSRANARRHFFGSTSILAPIVIEFEWRSSDDSRNTAVSKIFAGFLNRVFHIKLNSFESLESTSCEFAFSANFCKHSISLSCSFLQNDMINQNLPCVVFFGTKFDTFKRRLWYTPTIFHT